MAEAADGKKQALESQVHAFLASDSETLEFPTTLSTGERKVVHDLAFDNDLCRQSRGPRNGARFM